MDRVPFKATTVTLLEARQSLSDPTALVLTFSTTFTHTGGWNIDGPADTDGGNESNTGFSQLNSTQMALTYTDPVTVGGEFDLVGVTGVTWLGGATLALPISTTILAG